METQDELLRYLVAALEELQLPYAIAGSVAAMAYGEPRLTRDIDVLVSISSSDFGKLHARFPLPNFYFNDVAAAEAIANGGQFNIIHPASGFKIDVFVAHDAEDRAQIGRARALTVLPERTVSISAPEDLILNKLDYHRMGGSDKHLRDIAAMIQISGEEIDLAYIDREAERLGLAELWAAVRRRAERG